MKEPGDDPPENPEFPRHRRQGRRKKGGKLDGRIAQSPGFCETSQDHSRHDGSHVPQVLAEGRKTHHGEDPRQGRSVDVSPHG